MKKNIAIFTYSIIYSSLLFSLMPLSESHASFALNCDIKAKVIRGIDSQLIPPDSNLSNYSKTDKDLIKIEIEIIESKRARRSHGKCGYKPKDRVEIQIHNFTNARIKNGDILELHFSYVEGLGPNGVVSGSEWKLLKIN